jgi:hypothetical protein
MGAWGWGPFDNDDAADWVGEFRGADRDTGLRAVGAALRTVAEARPDDYLDAPEGTMAVAAAEVVAAVHGLDVLETSYNEELLAWVATMQLPADGELVSLAVQALERVKGPESELADLWDEVNDLSWRRAVDDRVASLRGLPSPD